ncbi:MAG: DUF1576 domain-containing protein [Spirochaetales bacterium]|nr:DUF1576 domain-containing protein [Spirochaetales bacterium]
MEKQNVILSRMLFAILVLMIFTGLIIDGPKEALSGLIRLQLQPGRLINDFIVSGGIGGTLINAALAGSVGLILLLILKVPLSGPGFAAIFTITGFGFFGKTPLNILPIILGVFISARFAGKSLREYILIALFGTALGPLVSFIVFEFGLTGVLAVLAGTAGGIFAGFFLPAIAMAMLHLHQGYNLYNMGFSCGFLALFAASLVKATGHQFQPAMNWYSGNSLLTVLIIPVLSLFFLIAGVAFEGKTSFRRFVKILKLPGRLPSDFMDLESMGGSFINLGFIGLAGSAYIFIVGGDFSGPIIGGLFTVMGFAAFGTHLRNSWPVLTGVILSTLVFGESLSAPGPLLAALFATTLAPLAGQFGILPGILAGFIHLFMVLQTGAWQGGMNLYNNGFAGGLTATLMVAVIQWYRSNKTDFT